MKLSYDWLKEYVDIKASPEEVARKLTMSGSEVEAIQEADRDKVMDLEITSNRSDCLSIIGLAREVSVVFGKDLCLPELKIPKDISAGKGPRVECTIKSSKLCPWYTARVITGVKVAGSSQLIKKHISAVGLRPVNNIVDITNYCLMELGQPLHAFDLNKIKGGKIIIREAVKNEKIVTIDGEERKLEPGMLVIADSERAIAIAGVMGGIDTEVSGLTKNILLESAYFDPISTRQTARALGLSSESSYRFERGVDKGMVQGASDRASMLIIKEAGGEICDFYDFGTLPAKDTSIIFDTEKAGKILGVSLDKKQVKDMFCRMGITVTKESGSKMTVKVPTFREDLKREVDLIEEVVRIYGYDNIPETTTKLLFQVERKEKVRLAEEKIRETLPALGLNEIITYSLISWPAIERFSGTTKGKPVEISNPLSEDQKFMTPQLLDGMLRAASWNINRGNKDLGLFEIGKIYTKEGKNFKETPALCIGVTGLSKENWKEGERKSSFYDLKGIVEELLSGLKLEGKFSSGEIDGLASCAKINIKEKELGFMGEVTSRVLKEYDIKQHVFICQIELAGLYDKAVLKDRYHSITRFPSTSRDISILCDKSVTAGEIFTAITSSGEEIIRGIKLADVYEGKQVPEGKKSLTFSIQYGLGTRTLRDEEVEAVHSQVKEALAKKFNVTFR